MTKRKTKDQDVHDECVESIANELKKDRWDVKANLKDWEKPTKLGGFRPDIEAKKDCLTRICEVVNEPALKKDKAQLTALKNYCYEYDFHLYVVDKSGKRKLIDPKTLEKK
jgi:hypothetical protein